MNRALEAFFADLLAAGVTLGEAREVRRSYADALSRQKDAAWVAFYRAVFTALSRIDTTAALPQTAARLAAQASLLRLLKDDLGLTLFSRSEMTNVRARLQPRLRQTLEERPRLDAILH